MSVWRSFIKRDLRNCVPKGYNNKFLCSNKLTHRVVPAHPHCWALVGEGLVFLQGKPRLKVKFTIKNQVQMSTFKMYQRHEITLYTDSRCPFLQPADSKRERRAKWVPGVSVENWIKCTCCNRLAHTFNIDLVEVVPFEFTAEVLVLNHQKFGNLDTFYQPTDLPIVLLVNINLMAKMLCKPVYLVISKV